MIRLIQTLFAVACILLIAGHHFADWPLKAIGMFTMLCAWGLTIIAYRLMKNVIHRNYYSKATKIL